MKPYTSTNPATGESYGTFPVVDDRTIGEAIGRADRAQATFRRTSVEERASILQSVAAAFRADAHALATVITEEMGKPIREAEGEVALVARIFDYYADEAGALLAPEQLRPASGEGAQVFLEPTGVILGIMPWNYPYYQVARLAAPSLLLGNAVLLKHARNCPRSALAFERVLADAGVPEGVYANLFADSGQIEQILADPRVQGVSLTGSEAAGVAVGQAAGKHLKKAVLELGGTDPLLVLDDADLEASVAAAVVGRMANAGQACTAAKRLIVLDPVYDRFVDRFLCSVENLNVADPMDPTSDMGPLSSEAGVEELEAIIDDAVAKGAKVLTGGARIDGPGHFFAPTVLADVSREMRAFHEELFGPVAVVYRVDAVEEALELANASVYGLGATVYCADDELAQRVARGLEAGMVNINCVSRSQPDLPFGGIKRSGMGRELGRFGLEEFANKKLVRRPAAPPPGH